MPLNFLIQTDTGSIHLSENSGFIHFNDVIDIIRKANSDGNCIGIKCNDGIIFSNHIVRINEIKGDSMPSIKVKLVNKLAQYPKFAHGDDAGADLYSCEHVTIQPNDRKLVNTGICLEIPHGYEGQIRSRSGNALRDGYIVLNSPGTIDSNYRGEIGVILYNTTESPIDIYVGDRIAQIVISEIPWVCFLPADELSESNRGNKGFGSTGR